MLSASSFTSPGQQPNQVPPSSHGAMTYNHSFYPLWTKKKKTVARCPFCTATTFSRIVSDCVRILVCRSLAFINVENIASYSNIHYNIFSAGVCGKCIRIAQVSSNVPKTRIYNIHTNMRTSSHASTLHTHPHAHVVDQMVALL